MEPLWAFSLLSFAPWRLPLPSVPILQKVGFPSEAAVCEWVVVMLFFCLFALGAAEFRHVDCHHFTVQKRALNIQSGHVSIHTNIRVANTLTWHQHFCTIINHISFILYCHGGVVCNQSSELKPLHWMTSCKWEKCWTQMEWNSDWEARAEEAEKHVKILYLHGNTSFASFILDTRWQCLSASPWQSFV